MYCEGESTAEHTAMYKHGQHRLRTCSASSCSSSPSDSISIASSTMSVLPCSPGAILEHFPNNPRIFSLEYRLSSCRLAPPQSNPCPAAIIDAIAGYRYLVQEVGFEPQNIILSGDSAGGNIAFGLALYFAKSKLPGLPPPGRLLLFSPAVDGVIRMLHLTALCTGMLCRISSSLCF